MLGVMSENRGNAVIFRCSRRLVAGEKPWALYNNVISQQGTRVVVLDFTGVPQEWSTSIRILLATIYLGQQMPGWRYRRNPVRSL